MQQHNSLLTIKFTKIQCWKKLGMSRHHHFDPLTVMHLSDYICVLGSRQIPSGWEAAEEAKSGDQRWNKREGSDESSAVWWIFWIVGQTQYLHWVVMASQTDCRLLGGQALHFKLTIAWLLIITLSTRRVKRREIHNFLCLLLLNDVCKLCILLWSNSILC